MAAKEFSKMALKKHLSCTFIPYTGALEFSNLFYGNIVTCSAQRGLDFWVSYIRTFSSLATCSPHKGCRD
jgi:hypothetical protein